MLFFLLSSGQVVCAGNDVDEIVIFFDQSASINDYDPKMVSRKWLTDFITTFNNTCKVTLFGFDDRLHKHGHVTIHTKKDVEILLEKISLIESHGLTTNFEIPFQHLLTLDNRESLKVAVITSDWEPEIWDEKQWYLSKSVRDDQRYEDLTRQYHLMKSQGESPEQIYKKLHALYQARNLELIEERLALVKESIGEKLFLLDIYGELEYFARWADLLDSDSISI
ncbi:MAG: hypothetical protein JRJ23_09780, partial [Deltaproteobacteria bacterium]|nr:hypothetical protein [Deltaproteobacteria bacterium]